MEVLGEGLEGGSGKELQADLGLRGTDSKALLRAACLKLSCSLAASAATDEEVWVKVKLRILDPLNGACLLPGRGFSKGEWLVVRELGEGALLPFISRWEV